MIYRIANLELLKHYEITQDDASVVCTFSATHYNYIYFFNPTNRLFVLNTISQIRNSLDFARNVVTNIYTFEFGRKIIILTSSKLLLVYDILHLERIDTMVGYVNVFNFMKIDENYIIFD